MSQKACQKRYYLKHKEILKEYKKEYWKVHSFEHCQNMRNFYQRYLDFMRKYERIRTRNRRSKLPVPHYKKESWTNSKVLVARQSNGQFVTWKELN